MLHAANPKTAQALPDMLGMEKAPYEAHDLTINAKI